MDDILGCSHDGSAEFMRSPISSISIVEYVFPSEDQILIDHEDLLIRLHRLAIDEVHDRIAEQSIMEDPRRGAGDLLAFLLIHERDDGIDIDIIDEDLPFIAEVLVSDVFIGIEEAVREFEIRIEQHHARIIPVESEVIGIQLRKRIEFRGDRIVFVDLELPEGIVEYRKIIVQPDIEDNRYIPLTVGFYPVISPVLET